MSSDEKNSALADTTPEDTPPESSTASKRKAHVEEIEVDITAPEPPSKRARRALKKGKSATSKPKRDNDNADLQDNDDDDDKQPGPKASRSEHGVWIGNLRFTVTPPELRTWLVDNSGGAITEPMMTRVNLPLAKRTTTTTTTTTPRRENRGFAYVDFVDVAAKLAALALSETELHGRRLLIKDARSFEGRPKEEKRQAGGGDGGGGEKNGSDKDGKNKGGQHVDPNASRKIFVGNMSFGTTEDDVKRNFARCGEIEWVKMATFEDSGKCKGFGWVKFREPEAAAWAVRGFVKIKEPVETEDDFRLGGEAGMSSSSDEEEGGGAKVDDDDGGGEEEEEEEEKGDDGKKGQDEEEALQKKKKKKMAASVSRSQGKKQFVTRKWYVNRMLGRELKLELAEDDGVRYRKRFGKDRPLEQRRRQQQQQQQQKQKQGSKQGPPAPGQNESVEDAGAAVDLQEARLMGKVVKHTGTKVTF